MSFLTFGWPVCVDRILLSGNASKVTYSEVGQIFKEKQNKIIYFPIYNNSYKKYALISLIGVPSAHVRQPCLQTKMWKNNHHVQTRIFANYPVKIYEK